MTQTIIDLSHSRLAEASAEEKLLQKHISRAYGISLVMVVEQGTPAIFSAIASAAQQPFVQQVILVDNGNKPEISRGLATLAQEVASVRLVRKAKAVPQGQALNQALLQVSQSYVLIMDQRYRLSDNASWRLLLAAQTLSEDFVMGVQRKDKADKKLPSCAYLHTPEEALQQLLRAGTKTPPIHITRSNVLEPYYVPAANAACIFMPTPLAASLKGWDDKTTIWGGYADFCIRVHQSHGNVYFLPDVSITEVTPPTYSVKTQARSALGLLRYYQRHYPQASRLVRWPLAVLTSFFCMAVPLFDKVKARWRSLSTKK